MPTGGTVDCLGVLGGSAVLDRCGVCNGDGSSCLECSTTDISQIQFEVDGHAFKQLSLVKRARRIILRTNVNQRETRALSALLVLAEQTYGRIWSNIWSYQSQIVSCSNAIFCSSTDLTNKSQSVVDDSIEMTRLLKKQIKIQRKSGNRIRAIHIIEMKMKKLQLEVSQQISQIPVSQSECS